MIDFMGSSPNGTNEYICLTCKEEFDLRHEDYEEPKFCPYCGQDATEEKDDN